MKQFMAMTDGKAIISTYAEDKQEATRAISILLRGRPGPDYYSKWVSAGKVIRDNKSNG